MITLETHRKDIQNLRQENELFGRQLSGGDDSSNNRESVSNDGYVPSVSGCQIVDTKNGSSQQGHIVDPRSSSQESDPDGRF